MMRDRGHRRRKAQIDRRCVVVMDFPMGDQRDPLAVAKLRMRYRHAKMHLSMGAETVSISHILVAYHAGLPSRTW
jgi:hypothetical protein